MNIRIIDVATGEKVDALILKAENIKKLPSLHDRWEFNFPSLMKSTANATAYVLVKELTPEIIEGCMIYQLLDKEIPYLAYLEVAPHNRTDPKKHENVAGCLLAYAYRLSNSAPSQQFKDMLMLHVMEEHKENEEKLVQLYKEKYGFYHRLESEPPLLEIFDERGEALIKKYLS